MRTKRFVGQLLIVAALGIMTAGTMSAGACNHCGSGPSYNNTRFSNNVQRYTGEGSFFERIWAWLHSMFPMA